MSALSGIRVVDASTGRAGPLAAMLLADFGADVVTTAERPHGFDVWGRGKRTAPGESSESLVRDADVLVVSDDAPVPAGDSRLVVLRTPPTLGPAPWAGGEESEALITAWYGIPLRQGSFDGGPVDSIYPVVTTLQGIWGAACAVAALFERERSGEGQVVTVSGDHGAMVATAGALTFTHKALAEAAAAPRRGRGPGGAIPFYRTYQCADGEWLFFAALTPHFTRIGFEVLGCTELFDDPRLGGEGRKGMIDPEHVPWVTDALAERFRTAPRDEWISKLRAAGCPAGALLDRDDWMDHPQVEAIGMRAEIEDPSLGRVVVPGVPLQLSGTGTGARPSGRHARRTDRGSLDGVRVLDLGAIIAGPFAASLLGDLGADVVKVEPLTGDSFRGPGFASYNKGQRGVALDLRHERAKAAFDDLVRSADVVLDNYRPGVLERLGIEWESLVRTNPNIISSSITGFGQGGPFGDDAGFDPVLQAMSGMMRAQGGDDDPVFFTVPVNDVAGSATLALGTVLALYQRERTGSPARVTTSLAAMSVLLQTEALVRYEGRVPAERGSRDHVGPNAFERFYRASDGWFRLHATGHEAELARIVGEQPIEDWAAGLRRDDAVARLTEAGIAAVAARTLQEIATDPRARADGVLHDDPRTDRDGCTAGRHAHFSGTMRTGVLVSPRLGEHTREVFAEIGYSSGEIDALIACVAAVAADTQPVSP